VRSAGVNREQEGSKWVGTGRGVTLFQMVLLFPSAGQVVESARLCERSLHLSHYISVLATL